MIAVKFLQPFLFSTSPNKYKNKKNLDRKKIFLKKLQKKVIFNPSL
jgi:hypothetical protein